MRVDLLLVPDCPHAAAARTVIADCLDQLGLDVAVLERVGDYWSPTVLVDGVDVMNDTTKATAGTRACRLDTPTAPRVLAALRGRLGRPGAPSGPPGGPPPAACTRRSCGRSTSPARLRTGSHD